MNALAPIFFLTSRLWEGVTKTCSQNHLSGHVVLVIGVPPFPSPYVTRKDPLLPSALTLLTVPFIMDIVLYCAIC